MEANAHVCRFVDVAPELINHCSYSQCGKYFSVSRILGKVEIFQSGTGMLLHTCYTPSMQPIGGVSFAIDSAKNQLLVVGCRSTLHIYSFASHLPVASITLSATEISALAMRDNVIITAHSSGEVLVSSINFSECTVMTLHYYATENRGTIISIQLSSDSLQPDDAPTTFVLLTTTGYVLTGRVLLNGARTRSESNTRSAYTAHYALNKNASAMHICRHPYFDALVIFVTTDNMTNVLVLKGNSISSSFIFQVDMRCTIGTIASFGNTVMVSLSNGRLHFFEVTYNQENVHSIDMRPKGPCALSNYEVTALSFNKTGSTFLICCADGSFFHDVPVEKLHSRYLYKDFQHEFCTVYPQHQLVKASVGDFGTYNTPRAMCAVTAHGVELFAIPGIGELDIQPQLCLRIPLIASVKELTAISDESIKASPLTSICHISAIALSPDSRILAISDASANTTRLFFNTFESEGGYTETSELFSKSDTLLPSFSRLVFCDNETLVGTLGTTIVFVSMNGADDVVEVYSIDTVLENVFGEQAVYSSITAVSTANARLYCMSSTLSSMAVLDVATSTLLSIMNLSFLELTIQFIQVVDEYVFCFSSNGVLCVVSLDKCEMLQRVKLSGTCFKSVGVLDVNIRTMAQSCVTACDYDFVWIIYVQDGQLHKYKSKCNDKTLMALSTDFGELCLVVGNETTYLSYLPPIEYKRDALTLN